MNSDDISFIHNLDDSTLTRSDNKRIGLIYNGLFTDNNRDLLWKTDKKEMAPSAMRFGEYRAKAIILGWLAYSCIHRRAMTNFEACDYFFSSLSKRKASQLLDVLVFEKV